MTTMIMGITHCVTIQKMRRKMTLKSIRETAKLVKKGLSIEKEKLVVWLVAFHFTKITSLIAQFSLSLEGSGLRSISSREHNLDVLLSNDSSKESRYLECLCMHYVLSPHFFNTIFFISF